MRLNRLSLATAILLLSSGCAHNYTRWTPPRPASVAKAVPASQLLGADAVGKEDKLYLTAEETALERYFRSLDIQGFSTDVSGEKPASSSLDVVALADENTAKLAALFADEYTAIKDAGRDPRFGIALSGGGVRSASFSQGILMGLYELGALNRAGYLSTVSGGGYTGAWYMLHGGRGADDPSAPHEPTDEQLFAPGGEHLQHLAQNGKFITTGHGSSTSMEYFLKSVYHFGLSVPGHWVTNGLIDLQINNHGVRDFYRKGIQASYMYAKPLTRKASERSKESIRGLLPSTEFNRPFWVLNMHLVLSDTVSSKNRSGLHFELAPLHAGGTEVGYIKVPEEHVYNWMTPAYGVTISGAAVDSAAVDSMLIHLGMQVLNLDIGYFIPGWSRGYVKEDAGSWARARRWAWAGGSLPVISWFDWAIGTKRRSRVQTKNYYVTDGGHFENTGAYSLVRRGCRLIIISDNGRDTLASDWANLSNEERARSFDDLRTFEERIYADFGADVTFEWETFCPELDPLDHAKGKTQFGQGPERTLLIGKIRNLPLHVVGEDVDTDVTILVFKGAYSIDERIRVKNGFIDFEKGVNNQFPADSTIDVNFSERQVLAYRALGHEMVMQNATDVQDAIDALDSP